MDTQAQIKEIVTSHPVVLFMKGTAQFPQCGFSGNAINILRASGVEKLHTDRKSTRLNSSHSQQSRMPSSA